TFHKSTELFDCCCSKVCVRGFDAFSKLERQILDRVRLAIALGDDDFALLAVSPLLRCLQLSLTQDLSIDVFIPVVQRDKPSAFRVGIAGHQPLKQIVTEQGKLRLLDDLVSFQSVLCRVGSGEHHATITIALEGCLIHRRVPLCAANKCSAVTTIENKDLSL